MRAIDPRQRTLMRVFVIESAQIDIDLKERDMSQTLGTTVLRKVLEHLETRPLGWCQGVGRLHLVVDKDPATISEALADTGREGCLSTLISCYAGAALETGPAREAAISDAIRLLCGHLGLPDNPCSVFELNDDICNTREHAAAFIRWALVREPMFVSA